MPGLEVSRFDMFEELAELLDHVLVFVVLDVYAGFVQELLCSEKWCVGSDGDRNSVGRSRRYVMGLVADRHGQVGIERAIMELCHDDSIHGCAQLLDE